MPKSPEQSGPEPINPLWNKAYDNVLDRIAHGEYFKTVLKPFSVEFIYPLFKDLKEYASYQETKQILLEETLVHNNNKNKILLLEKDIGLGPGVIPEYVIDVAEDKLLDEILYPKISDLAGVKKNSLVDAVDLTELPTYFDEIVKQDGNSDIQMEILSKVAKIAIEVADSFSPINSSKQLRLNMLAQRANLDKNQRSKNSYDPASLLDPKYLHLKKGFSLLVLTQYMYNTYQRAYPLQK